MIKMENNYMKEIYFNVFEIQETYSNNLISEYESTTRSLKDTIYVVKGRTYGASVKSVVPSIILKQKLLIKNGIGHQFLDQDI